MAHWTDNTVAVRKRHMDEADLQFASAKHQAGVPPSAIARMMGVCREDVERLLPRQPLRSAPTPRAISSPSVTASAKRQTAPPKPPRLIDRITRQVAVEHGLTVAELIGPSMRRRHVVPRHQLMWMLYQERDVLGRRRFSTIHIGTFLGGRDHSTVMHGITRHEERRASPTNVDPGLFDPIERPEIVENQSGEAVSNHQPHPSEIQTVEV